MTDKNQKQTLCLVAWVGFIICVTVFLHFADLNGRAYWNGGIIMLLAVGQFLLALHYTKTILEKEHIRVDTHGCTESEIITSIVLLPWSTGFHADIGKQLLKNLVSRMILEPLSVGTFGRVKVLVSKAGDALTSSQADVILSGIRVEVIPREQIINLLKRRTAFHRAEKWPEFQTQLLKTLLRNDLEEEKREWQLIAEDLDLLESILRDVSPLSEAVQNSIRLRLEVGVRLSSKVLSPLPPTEKAELFTRLIVGRAEGPFTPAPPPTAAV